jgi:hypothetical protein
MVVSKAEFQQMREQMALQQEQTKLLLAAALSVAKKADGPVDGDGKSNVSRITQKTIRGKTSNKHCPLCNFKLVPGPDCSRHCNRRHKGIEVALIKCDATCSHCKSK